LVVDPGRSGDGFDDVQDLHDERTKNNTAKGCGAQSAKAGAGLQRWSGPAKKLHASGRELSAQAQADLLKQVDFKSDAGRQES
jgi:hypothetical protein